jgi:hypothetical protein
MAGDREWGRIGKDKVSFEVTEMFWNYRVVMFVHKYYELVRHGGSLL